MHITPVPVFFDYGAGIRKVKKIHYAHAYRVVYKCMVSRIVNCWWLCSIMYRKMLFSGISGKTDD